MNFQNFSFVLTFILFSVFFNFPWETKAESNLIKTVCSQTTNSTFCTATLESDPNSSKAANFMALSEAALKLAIANARNSISFAKSELTKAKTPAIIKALQGCVDGYTYAWRAFGSAIKELKEDPMSANYDSKVAGDGFNDCEAGLAAGKVENAEISARSKVGGYFSSIAFSATNQLDG